MNKAELLQKCTDLGIDTSGLDTNAKLKAAIEAKEAEKAAAEKAAAEKAEKEVPVYEDEKGRKWSFKATAPKKINIDGHSMTQEEIFEDEDIISELIYGNSTLLIQKSK